MPSRFVRSLVPTELPTLNATDHQRGKAPRTEFADFAQAVLESARLHGQASA